MNIENLIREPLESFALKIRTCRKKRQPVWSLNELLGTPKNWDLIRRSILQNLSIFCMVTSQSTELAIRSTKWAEPDLLIDWLIWLSVGRLCLGCADKLTSNNHNIFIQTRILSHLKPKLKHMMYNFNLTKYCLKINFVYSFTTLFDKVFT